MTRPKRADWHRSWRLEVGGAEAEHAETGLHVRFEIEPWHGSRALERIGTVAPRSGAGDSARWAVVAPCAGPGSLQAARASLEARLGLHNGAAAAQRLVREAALLWLFQLERGRVPLSRVPAAA